MTEDNRRQNVAEQLVRSDEAFRAAEGLLALGLHADAVSRAYYAAFHCLLALLLSRGLEPKTHRGAITLLNQEFIRSGRLSSAHNRLLGGLQRSRELADYSAGIRFSADDARALIEDARAFEREARGLLTRED